MTSTRQAKDVDAQSITNFPPSFPPKHNPSPPSLPPLTMAGTGFKLSLAGAKKPGGIKPPPAKRPRLAALGDEPEDADKQQEILGWDTTAGGAIELNGKTKKEEEAAKAAPRVIASQPNRNWREDALKKHSGSGGSDGAPPGANPQQQTPGREMEEKPQLPVGLNLFPKKEESQDTANTTSEPMTLDPPAPESDDTLTPEQRLEKDALAALITGETPNHTVIPLSRTDQEAFEEDYNEARPAPTTADYDATPIDGFGAALLRGMGWKDGEELGLHRGDGVRKKAAPPKEVKARPALLGIGAKPEAAMGLEPKSAKAEKAATWKAKEALYKPATLAVAVRNKKTGEMMSEDEYNKMLEKQKFIDDGGGGGADHASSSRNTERDGRSSSSRKMIKYAGEDEDEDEYRRAKRRDRERRDRDRDRRDGDVLDDRYDSEPRRRDKHRDRDRDRYSESQSHSHRSSRRDDDDDDEYRSSHKSKSKSSRSDRDRDRDYERRDRDYERSSRGGGGGDKDKSRSSYRDNDDDRDRRHRRPHHHHRRSPSRSRSRSRSPKRRDRDRDRERGGSDRDRKRRRDD
ncbi:unnamed protein product [Periconia digitata]|uniref:Pre-mRNA-splicing factor n=1 Tax=Periconia digitata TaxID=1303443 RepID=A0A9W4XWU4_9PLEO|nr:unnamed protein product [Periconia digitata]